MLLLPKQLSLSLDPSSPYSGIPLHRAHPQPGIYFYRVWAAGLLGVSVFPLSMITTNRSQLGFVHVFSLPSDVVLGDDRVRPLIVEDPSVIRWPCPLLLDGFSSPHSGSQV